MFTFVKASFTKAVVGRLANDNDLKTTVLGVAAAALLAGKLDWGKLLSGDSTEIGTAVGVVLAALIGFYTNKPSKTPEKAR